MKTLKEAIKKASKELGWEETQFGVEHPNDESHGDYSTNIALIVGKQRGEQPRELAEKLVAEIRKDPIFVGNFEKVEVAGAGFINFWVTEAYLLSEMERAQQAGYGKNENLKGQKTYVEYTDPNPFKEMHIGHLMSNTIGESLARILEANGAEVKRACYQGDVGLHVAKSIWGWQKLFKEKNLDLQTMRSWSLKERQKLMGEAYAYGAGKYEEEEVAKQEMQTLNQEIYEGLSGGKGEKSEVMELYWEGRKWSLEYFEVIYQRLGTKFDEYYFESEAGPVGLKVVEEGLTKKVLEVGEEGAVIYRGEKDGLHTRVFRSKLGLPTYEAKDLGLAKTKEERFKYDKSYIITANEIDEYFKVVLKVMEQLYPGLRAKTTHLSHGMMKLVSGKMSSRTGKVVTGEGLLNELKEVVIAKMGEREIVEREKIADQVAVGSLKYMVLKQDVGGDIIYEPEKMTNLEGNTGPYLQYTYARAMSVLKKAGTIKGKEENLELNPEEEVIARWLYRYPEVVEEAGESLKPSVIATYVNELASRFNSFYNKHQIVGSEGRVVMTKAVANVIYSGLGLLGIEAPREM
ncbi:MAG: arginine--tRNA ligase [bacterium]